ncbi:SIMPL domain-containing protein [Flavisolibacter nicotianae]|uniref:SIMPL domain-containing protein n=1 Tax=Flavisolibacter nicotianae TaxID=2364882 RepID=UPI000EB1D2BB|nr:SIMPL domain-containing protein [Flavisolibacter nicotianae]
MRLYMGHLIIAVAIILAVFLAAATVKYKFKSAETITVTGLAEKDFVADQIVWTGNFVRNGFDLKTAYEEVKRDEGEIKRYLNTAGIADTNIVFSSVNMNRNYEQKYDPNGRVIGSTFTGYNLSESVTVASRNLDVVEKMSRQITNLLQKGIELNSSAPSYYYSRLNELKIDLLAKASADAKARAESIAKNSGALLGDLRKANMGVFQITGKNANEDYSYGGAFNTTSKEKTASITLKVDYQVR